MPTISGQRRQRAIGGRNADDNEIKLRRMQSNRRSNGSHRQPNENKNEIAFGGKKGKEEMQFSTRLSVSIHFYLSLAGARHR